MDTLSSVVPVKIYGVVFRNEDTGEESLDAGTLRYTLDGARLAANEIRDKMYPEARRRMKPHKIMKLLLTKE